MMVALGGQDGRLHSGTDEGGVTGGIRGVERGDTEVQQQGGLLGLRDDERGSGQVQRGFGGTLSDDLIEHRERVVADGGVVAAVPDPGAGDVAPDPDGVPPTDGPQDAREPAGAIVLDPAVVAWVCWLPWPCGEAVHVALCESNGDPLAWNDWSLTADPNDGVAGLYQLSVTDHADLIAMYGGDPFDVLTNTQAAYFLYESGLQVYGYGWHAWAWACRP